MSGDPHTEHGFVPHRIKWTEETIRRFWDGAASLPEYTGKYFSREAGDAVLAVFSAFVPLGGLCLTSVQARVFSLRSFSREVCRAPPATNRLVRFSK